VRAEVILGKQDAKNKFMKDMLSAS